MRNTYTHTRKCMRKYYYRAGERMDHSINDVSHLLSCAHLSGKQCPEYGLACRDLLVK